MSTEVDRSDAPRRSVTTVALVAGLLTALGGSAVVLAARQLPGSDDGLLLGLLPVLVLLVGHLWAGRWRILLALALTALPGLLLLGAVPVATDPDEGVAFALTLVGIAAVLVVGTAALAVWVANRWGRRKHVFLDDLNI